MYDEYDHEDEDEFSQDCENCGSEITTQEYNMTGTTEYCYECPELECHDPRGHTFGTCGCEEDEDA